MGRFWYLTGSAPAVMLRFMAQSQVKLYCEPDFNERVKKAAKKDGRSVSKWLIKAAEEKMVRDRGGARA